MEKSLSDPSNSFNCDVTSTFDLRIFLLLGLDSSSASRFCCGSVFWLVFGNVRTVKRQGKKPDWFLLVERYNLELNGYCQNDEILDPSRNQKRLSKDVCTVMG